MTSQEQIPNSLPDTQDTVVATSQSQEAALSQQQTLHIWGRLYPLRASLKTLDLTKDMYTLGRSPSCDICLTLKEVAKKKLELISKEHFCIYRERINGRDDILTYLEDRSGNGTFVDEIKVGRGKRVIIESTSMISLLKPKQFVYTFISTIMPVANDLPKELKEKYALGRKLGAGAYGEVKMIYTRDGTKRFAMKMIKKLDSDINDRIDSFTKSEKIQNEVEILKRLKHPCITQMEEIHDTPSAVYIILELMEGGELFERIRRKGRIPEPFAKLIFYQVVLAVHYLHTQGITHRDLKPENILLACHSDITKAKVSDFGLSKLVDTTTMMKTVCGTLMYLAPEVLLNCGHSTVSYTNQVDVWSLGVILYTCLSGMVPFNPQAMNCSLQNQIRYGRYNFPESHFKHVSQDAIQLIKCMMMVNPHKRITVPQILLHPWLADARMREIVDMLIYPKNDENVSPPNVDKDHQKMDLHPRLTKRPRFNA